MPISKHRVERQKETAEKEKFMFVKNTLERSVSIPRLLHARLVAMQLGRTRYVAWINAKLSEIAANEQIRIPPGKREKWIQLGAHDKNRYADTKELLHQTVGEQNSELLADLLAATSLSSGPSTNVYTTMEVLRAINDGRFQEGRLPMLLQGTINQVTGVLTGEGLTGRKVWNFSEGMKGNPDIVTVDKHMGKLFGFGREQIVMNFDGKEEKKTSGLSNREYDVVEFLIRQQAAKRDLTPAEMTGVMQYAAKNNSVRKLETTFNRPLENYGAQLKELITEAKEAGHFAHY